MKTFSSGLSAQLLSHRSRLTTCIRLTRRFDGRIFGFTMFDRKLIIGGVAYRPTASFNPSDIASNANMDQDSITVQALIDDNTLSEEDLRAGKWDYSAYRIFQVNWEDLTQGDKKDKTGHLAQVTAGRQIFLAELLGLLEAYTISIGDITCPGCRANLGDQWCKVDLSASSPAWTVAGTITGDDGDFFSIYDSSRTEADSFFAEGVIRFLSGQANGLSYDIKNYRGSDGRVITKTPIAYNVLGAAYSMHAGCDKSLATCRDRFGNVVNFRGEPWLRGPDAMIQVGRHSG